VARFVVGKPELRLDERYGNYRVRFPLELTPSERERVEEDNGPLPLGVQQSTRTMYTPGLSLGWVGNDGQYHSTMLIDFIAACLGSTQVKKFREWIAKGGGPPRPTDLDDQKAELDLIAEWLGWWEGLEVYGTIRHQDSKDGSRVWANFAGPMAVGSLPGEKDEEYQAHGRGKLRALMAESGETRESHSREARGIDRPAEQFTADGEPVDPDEQKDLPF
jgi:hypothetical protein